MDKSQEPITDISVTLTKKPLPKTDLPFNYSLNYLSLRKKDKSPLNPINTWKKVSGIYKANGRERYLSIGNFSEANKSSLEQSKGVGDSLYYCFDNIEVIPFFREEEPNQTEDKLISTPISTESKKEHKPQNHLDTESIIIENSYFDFNSYQLKEKTDSLFNQLVGQLLPSELKSITVIGHTDTIGDS